jgi:hypothetical protein
MECWNQKWRVLGTQIEDEANTTKGISAEMAGNVLLCQDNGRTSTGEARRQQTKGQLESKASKVEVDFWK